MAIYKEKFVRSIIKPITNGGSEETQAFDYGNIINVYPIETVITDLDKENDRLYFFKVMDNFGLYGCSRLYEDFKECVDYWKELITI